MTLPNQSIIEFGINANIIVVAAVVILGLFWVFRKSESPSHLMRIRAFQFWWASWFMWLFAWGAIKFDKEILILVFDNLNTVCLLLMYFVLTRGEEYSVKRSFTDFFKVIASLTIIYGVLYWMFSYNVKIAIAIHHISSLSFGLFTPLLIGWGFRLRFNTNLMLYVGAAYGFMQPFIFNIHSETISNAVIKEQLTEVQPTFDLLLAFLKIVWAVLSFNILYNAKTTTGNLVAETVPKPYGVSEFFKRWNRDMIFYTFLLVIVFIVLIVFLIQKELSAGNELLQNFSRAVCTVGAVVGIIAFVVTLITKLATRSDK